MTNAGNMKELELLAPAKNKEQGIAAINHGADAVYIAGPAFGAREAAANTIHDIELLCQYAHKYYAKTYLTLNTILYDHELEQARELVYQAYNSGCDAIIVQDMALLEMDLPPIPLFASTQTDNYTPEKVKFLEDVGFQRVILARELSLEQIKEISNNTSVDLEAFVHGAICVSYSGRCYLSQMLASRSANRGSCAQLCRLPFDLYNSKGVKIEENKHLLSVKDMNMSAHLADLVDAGVTSFKIEGRLKDMSYVKNITAYYRKCLDNIINKSVKYKRASSGTTKFAFEPDPERTFSRGYTTYFALGRSKGLNAGAAKSVGKYCGKVIACDNKTFKLDTGDLINGDGICFFDTSGKLTGTRINSVSEGVVSPLSMNGITKGTKIFRNSDRMFDKTLAGESATRKIQVNISLIVSDNSVQITAVDEDGIKAEIKLSHQMEKARNIEKIKDTIINQFSKTGNEIFNFTINSIDCEYFFPISEINNWRRLLSAKLETQREKSYKRNTFKIAPSTIPYIADNINFTANVSNHLAERFYKRHGVVKIEKAVETGTIPAKVMFNKYCIKYELGICPVKQGGKETGDLFLHNSGKVLKLKFDCKNCEMSIEISTK